MARHTWPVRAAACAVAATVSLLAGCGAPNHVHRPAPHRTQSRDSSSSPTAKRIATALVGKFKVTSMDFPTPRTGYVTVSGYPNDKSALYSWIDRTADGGRTWTALPAAKGDAAPPSGNIAWVTAQDAWSSTVSYATHKPVPVLHYTTDGGATWQTEPEPFWVSPIAVADGSSWLIAFPLRCPGSFCRDTIYSADRVGGALTRLPSQPSRTESIYALVRTDAERALAVLARRNHFRLVATTDAGQSWTGRPLPCGPSVFSVATSVAPDGAVFLTCTGRSTSMCESCGPVTIYRSSDLGATWTKTPARGTGTFFCCVSALVGAAPESVWALQAFPVGPGRVWHSANDGGSFTPVLGKRAAQGPYFDLLAAHGRTAVVIANESGAAFAVDRTTDDGKTWRRTTLPLTANLPRH